MGRETEAVSSDVGDFMKKNSIVMFLLIWGGMYLLSAVLLAILAAVLWKMHADSGVVSGTIVAVYVVVSFLGGFLIGGFRGKQKMFWGCAIGLCYFILLLLAGIWLMGTTISGNSWIFSGCMVCAVTGMLGGMLAPARRR